MSTTAAGRLPRRRRGGHLGDHVQCGRSGEDRHPPQQPRRVRREHGVGPVQRRPDARVPVIVGAAGLGSDLASALEVVDQRGWCLCGNPGRENLDPQGESMHPTTQLGDGSHVCVVGVERVVGLGGTSAEELDGRALPQLLRSRRRRRDGERIQSHDVLPRHVERAEARGDEPQRRAQVQEGGDGMRDAFESLATVEDQHLGNLGDDSAQALRERGPARGYVDRAGHSPQHLVEPRRVVDPRHRHPDAPSSRKPSLQLVGSPCLAHARWSRKRHEAYGTVGQQVFHQGQLPFPACGVERDLAGHTCRRGRTHRHDSMLGSSAWALHGKRPQRPPPGSCSSTLRLRDAVLNACMFSACLGHLPDVEAPGRHVALDARGSTARWGKRPRQPSDDRR